MLIRSSITKTCKTSKAEVVENLDIIVIQYFATKNNDCEEPDPTERADSLVYLAVGYSTKSLPQKPIHLICSDEIIVGS